MATVGLVQPWLMGLVPGRLMLTASHLIPRLSTRRTARMLVGTVSPSAVWYTSKRKSTPIELGCDLRCKDSQFDSDAAIISSTLHVFIL